MNTDLLRTESNEEGPYHSFDRQKAESEEYSQVGNESLINYPARAR